MKHSVWSLALREWRQHILYPVTLVAVLAAGTTLGIAGPFGTSDLLPFIGRLAYWVVLCFVCYAIGSLMSSLVQQQGWSFWRSVILQGLGTSLTVLCVVILFNWLVFGWLPYGAELLSFAATLIAITLIVTGVMIFAAQRSPQPMPDTPAALAPAAAAPAAPAILDRIALRKRGALVALSVEDHYVRIQTVAGEDMVLMRLSDAVKEVSPCKGAQIHRSHWVAFDQVTHVARKGDRAILTMSTGAEIPASRANLPRLKEAGLLPR